MHKTMAALNSVKQPKVGRKLSDFYCAIKNELNVAMIKVISMLHLESLEKMSI